MKNQKGFTIVEQILAIVWVIGFIGWIINIVAVVHGDFANISGLLVVRCIGIFIAPIGAFLGLFF